MLDDPLAFFLTWSTYGTWLPGDSRGWTEYRYGWQMPNSIRELECAARMTEDAYLLSPEARQIVENQVAETCFHRGWKLHAVNCRSNHVHAVIASPAPPKQIRTSLKAWCTRRLKEQIDPIRENWWTERGSIRWIFKESQLDSVLLYVMEAQDRKHLDRPRSDPLPSPKR